MAKNIHGKTRKVEYPYHVIKHDGFEYRILKRYQSPEKEKVNPFAKWYCAVASPYNYSWEFGDIYIKDIPNAIAGMEF